MISREHLWILALALIIDAIIGDPKWLWNRLPHPVVIIGRMIAMAETKLNRKDTPPERRAAMGAGAIVVIVFAAFAAGLIVERVFSSIAFGWIGTAIVGAIMLAGRDLYDHVAAVAKAFDTGGIDAARNATSKIVGRDTADLDEAAISRAAIESAAENFSDGLVAPAFWFALLGLPGLLAYKAINTADSMIGHRTPRYREFGRAAARLDDAVNWLPARLSGLLVLLAAPLVGGSPSTSFRVMFADAGKHRSPNAGWPESAMAGALGIALAGPRPYDGKIGDDAFINKNGADARVADIRQALRVYTGAWALLLFAVLLVAAVFL